MVKKIFMISTVFVFVLGLSSFMFAQDKPKLDDRTKQRLETQLKEMDAAVKFTTEQKTKVNDLLVKNALASPRMDRSRMRDMSRDERMEMIQKSREAQQKTNKEIEKLLNKEQVPKFKKYLEKQQQNRRGRRRG